MIESWKQQCCAFKVLIYLKKKRETSNCLPKLQVSLLESGFQISVYRQKQGKGFFNLSSVPLYLGWIHNAPKCTTPPKTCLVIQRDSTVWRKEFWDGNETSLLVCLTNNLCYFQSVSSQRLCFNLRWKEGYDLDDPVPPLIPNDDATGQFGKLKNYHLWVHFFKLMQQALVPGRNHPLRKAGFV